MLQSHPHKRSTCSASSCSGELQDARTNGAKIGIVNTETDVPDARVLIEVTVKDFLSRRAPTAVHGLQLQAAHHAGALQGCCQSHGLAGMHERRLRQKREHWGLSEGEWKGRGRGGVRTQPLQSVRIARARRQQVGGKLSAAEMLTSCGRWAVERESSRSVGAAATVTCLKLRRVEFNLESASTQQALFHQYNGVAQAPKLLADGERRAVGPERRVNHVDDVTQLPVAVLGLDCNEKRGG